MRKNKRSSGHSLKNLVKLVEIRGKAFKEAKTEIEVLASGEWKHPSYGMIKITDASGGRKVLSSTYQSGRENFW